ncbi:MAG: hypothetical protein NVSMB27_45840 [Ktedonobacteraceae bacterium]
MATNIIPLVQTLLPVVEALEHLNIPYYIGGSVASSLYGDFRPTQDVDIVADMHLSQVRSFVKLLEKDYYVVEDAIRNAIRRRSSFNFISNTTFLKADVFMLKARAFDQDALRSLRRQALVKGGVRSCWHPLRM